MAEAFIMGGGHITLSPSVNVNEQPWTMLVPLDSFTATTTTKTYSLEFAPSYITISANGNGENNIKGVYTGANITNLPYSLSNGKTMTLAYVASGDGSHWHKVTVTLSGSNVIFTNSVCMPTYDSDGYLQTGYRGYTYVRLSLFIVGTM